MANLETDFNQLVREFVWNCGDADAAFNSYFDVMDYEQEDCDLDEIADFLSELENDRSAVEIASKYGMLAAETGNPSYIDEGEALI